MPRYALNAKTITPALTELAKQLGCTSDAPAEQATFLRANIKQATDAMPDDALLAKQAKTLNKDAP